MRAGATVRTVRCTDEPDPLRGSRGRFESAGDERRRGRPIGSGRKAIPVSEAVRAGLLEGLRRKQSFAEITAATGAPEARLRIIAWRMRKRLDWLGCRSSFDLPGALEYASWFRGPW